MSEVCVSIKNASAWYGNNQALANINLDIPKNCIYAFIGPSGCGKTTLLRSINRLNDLVPTFRLSGEIEVNGESVYAISDKKSVEALRRKIGMVFQQPNPLPMTVMQNMLLPVKEHFSDSHQSMAELAIENLKITSLYDEIKDRLNKTAMQLSGGQQQRLCIARALMLNPNLILFDEPCSALDPISTFAIEGLLMTLKQKYTIIMVTHNMEQARRVSDYTAFFYKGKIIETGKTLDIFNTPKEELTQNYVRGVI